MPRMWWGTGEGEQPPVIIAPHLTDLGDTQREATCNEEATREEKATCDREATHEEQATCEEEATHNEESTRDDNRMPLQDANG